MATETDNGIWGSFGRHLRTATRTGPRSMSNDVQAGKPIPKPFREKSFGPFKIWRYNISKLINVVCPMVATPDCWRVFSGAYLSRRRIATTAAVRRENTWFGPEARSGPGPVERCKVHFSSGLTDVIFARYRRSKQTMDARRTTAKEKKDSLTNSCRPGRHHSICLMH